MPLKCLVRVVPQRVVLQRVERVEDRKCLESCLKVPRKCLLSAVKRGVDKVAVRNGVDKVKEVSTKRRQSLVGHRLAA